MLRHRFTQYNKKLYNIKDSVVCWYDVIKQLCTNESLSLNPLLIDYSNKGNNLILSGFSFNTSSGINNNSLVFNGINNSATSSESLLFGTLFTVLFDIDWNSIQAAAGITKANNFYLYKEPTSLHLYLKSSVEDVMNTIPINTVAFNSNGLVYDSSLNKILATALGTSSDLNTNLYIGWDGISTYCAISFRRLIIFDRVLSDNEIAYAKLYFFDPVRTSMVAWYDIARQGCTNENMAANPILEDLSGNGHNVTCYNFAWNGFSGIVTNDICVDDLIYLELSHGININRDTPNLIYLTGNSTSKVGGWNHIAKIPCLIGEHVYLTILFERLDNHSMSNPVITMGNYWVYIKPGIYTYEFIPTMEYATLMIDLLNDTTIADCRITFFPYKVRKALVADGVNDYCRNETLLPLNDFTLFFKARYLSDEYTSVYGRLFTKSGTNIYNNDLEFSFYETSQSSTNYGFDCFKSNNNHNVIVYNPDIVHVVTPLKFDTFVITRGGNINTSLGINLFNYYTTDFGKWALHLFILFDRTLTLEEIRRVKTEFLDVFIPTECTLEEMVLWGFATKSGNNYTITGSYTTIPIISDLAKGLSEGTVKFQHLDAPEFFWNDVKDKLSTGPVATHGLPSMLYGSNISGEVIINIGEALNNFSAEDIINGTLITNLTLLGTNSMLSSTANAFRRNYSLQSVTVDTPIYARDLSGMFEWCNHLLTFPSIYWGIRTVNLQYPLGTTNTSYMCDGNSALLTIPQYGEDREADSNTLRVVAGRQMLINSGVKTLGPVLDLTYADPTIDWNTYGILNNNLVDARIKNLNHGDWWFDGTGGTIYNKETDSHLYHGNLSNLNEDSVLYLLNNLTDLTTDKHGPNWRTINNSFLMWAVNDGDNSPGEVTDSTVVLKTRGKSGTTLLATIFISDGNTLITDFLFSVSGLQNGDRLELGSGIIDATENSIYLDGVYTRSVFGNSLKGFKIYNDSDITPTNNVTITIINPYDPSNHLVDSAILHVPESWRSIIKGEIYLNVINKGWKILIGSDILPLIPDSIRDNLILYYDVNRLKCTNESMASDPKLIDFSGNNHDATCYNFAWSGMSGIGGYSLYHYNDFNGMINCNAQFERLYDGTNIIGVHYTKTGDNNSFYNSSALQFSTSSDSIVETKRYKISGLPNGWSLLYYFFPSAQNPDNGEAYKAITNIGNGIITIPRMTGMTYPQFRFEHTVPLNTECDIKIELLPEYSGALVSDGVNDYCQVVGLPLLNNGYTIIAKRKLLDNSDMPNYFLCANREALLEGAFSFEGYSGAQKRCTSYSRLNVLKDFFSEDITYQTSSFYNGNSINRGTIESLLTALTLFNVSKANNYQIKAALYSLLLFNRDLTEEEINLVKINWL